MKEEQIDSCLSQKCEREMIKKQLRPEFELGSLILFPMTITVTLTAPPNVISFIDIDIMKKMNE